MLGSGSLSWPPLSTRPVLCAAKAGRLALEKGKKHPHRQPACQPLSLFHFHSSLYPNTLMECTQADRRTGTMTHIQRSATHFQTGFFVSFVFKKRNKERKRPCVLLCPALEHGRQTTPGESCFRGKLLPLGTRCRQSPATAGVQEPADTLFSER